MNSTLSPEDVNKVFTFPTDLEARDFCLKLDNIKVYRRAWIGNTVRVKAASTLTGTIEDIAKDCKCIPTMGKDSEWSDSHKI